jgi:hypothetical protein
VFHHEALENWSDVCCDPRAIRRHRWRQLTYITDPARLDFRWESRVVDARALVFDAHDGRFSLNEHLMPPIPGTLRAWREQLCYNRYTRQLGELWLKLSN